MAEGYQGSRRAPLPITPESAEQTAVSTPLARIAGRLESALPDGWRVMVVDAPDSDSAAYVQPVLQAVPVSE